MRNLTRKQEYQREWNAVNLTHKRDYERERYHRLQATGLCRRCAKPRDGKSKVHCLTCGQKAKNRDRKFYGQLKQNGLCLWCKEPTGGRRYCPQHAAAANEHKKNRYRRLKIAAFEAYGGAICACCGETEVPFLALDHIENNGAEERRRLGGASKGAGWHFYHYLAKCGFLAGYQVLCHNCNFGKHLGKGVCLHQSKKNESFRITV